METYFTAPKGKRRKIMAKQIIKGMTMLLLVMAVAFVTAVVSANGQSRHQVAKIPFEFVVGDNNLPAGQYDVTAMTSNDAVLRITNSEQRQTAIRLTQTISHTKPADKGKLVFRRYADRYFLAEVWSAGDTSGRQLMKSKQERAIERELASVPSKSEWAQSGYQIVEIAAVSH
jgi:hypothetical protein